MLGRREAFAWDAERRASTGWQNQYKGLPGRQGGGATSLLGAGDASWGWLSLLREEMCVKAETFDGEEEVGWWTPDGRQTHVGPPQHWDRDQVLLLPGKVASLLLETVVNLLLETFGITLLDCAA